MIVCFVGGFDQANLFNLKNRVQTKMTSVTQGNPPQKTFSPNLLKIKK